MGWVVLYLSLKALHVRGVECLEVSSNFVNPFRFVYLDSLHSCITSTITEAPH